MSESETKDNFEKGIFWELYLDLERQFQSFLEYVPYLEGNERTYSYKLLNMILSIGGHVDSAFKEMARFPRFSSNSKCREILELLKGNKTVEITLPLEAFEEEYSISKKAVLFKCVPEDHEIRPFEPRSDTAPSPSWWKIYNGLKHDAGVNLKEANLLNTLNALAGAFLVNVIHEPAILRFDDLGMLTYVYKPDKSKYMLSTEKSWDFPRDVIQDMLEKGQQLPFGIETQLFMYEYEQ
jgi:hypothetical protein